MDRLPVEIIERIFYYLDGYSLIKSQTVCTFWRDIAKLFDKNDSHWRSLCFDEISRSVLLELTVKKYPFWRPNSKAGTELDWKELYMTWLNWKILTNFTYHLDIVSEHKPGHVTCLKLLADAIIVGLHNGEINTWETLSGDPYVVSKHRTRVTCLEVISVLDERKEAVDNKQLHYVVSTSNDGRVKVSYLIKEGMSPKVFDVCQHHCPTLCIRVQQSYFAVLDANGTVTVWLIDPPKSKGIMPTVHLVANYRPQAGNLIVSLDIWGDMVTGITNYGTVLNADFYESKDIMTVVHSPKDRTVHVTVVGGDTTYLTQVNYHNEVGIGKCYNWRNQIFLWITDLKKMMISLDGYHYYEYDTNKVLKSWPKSAFLYGNILFLGMESGSVYMYFFETPEELIQLDLKKFHWHHPIASTPIIAIDICEDSSGPMLAVLSKSYIHMIEWTLTIDDIVDNKFPLNTIAFPLIS